MKTIHLVLLKLIKWTLYGNFFRKIITINVLICLISCVGNKNLYSHFSCNSTNIVPKSKNDLNLISDDSIFMSINDDSIKIHIGITDPLIEQLYVLKE